MSSRSRIRHGPAALLLALAALRLGAEPLALATGDYAPFVGPQLPSAGITAAVVSAAFKTQGVEVRFAFLPWKRGYLETQAGRYAGTFPYLKTPERELAFLFSEPIFRDRFRLFVRRPEAPGLKWARKTLCVPLGYDVSQIAVFIHRHQLKLVQPPSIANCFKMLERVRVDAVWVSEWVGATTAREVLAHPDQVQALETRLVDDSSYYLMVPRQLPNAKALLARFNTGLAALIKAGEHAEILRRFGG